MTIRQELMVLRASLRIKMRTVKEIEKQIDKLQKKCLHARIRHKLVPDSYMGQTRSSACADCGKSFGSATYHVTKQETRTWIEKVEK